VKRSRIAKGVDQRTRATRTDRQVPAAGQCTDDRRIARRLRNIGIAGHRGYPKNIEAIRVRERHQQRDSVIVPRIAAD
jgi:hypothetical protein